MYRENCHVSLRDGLVSRWLTGAVYIVCECVEKWGQVCYNKIEVRIGRGDAR